MQLSLTERLDIDDNPEAGLAIRDAAPVHVLDDPTSKFSEQTMRILSQDEQRSVIDERRNQSPTANQFFPSYFAGNPSEDYTIHDDFNGRVRNLTGRASDHLEGTRPYRIDSVATTTKIETKPDVIPGTGGDPAAELQKELQAIKPVRTIQDSKPGVRFSVDDAYDCLDTVLKDFTDRLQAPYESDIRPYRITDLVIGEPYIHHDRLQGKTQYHIIVPVLSLYGENKALD